MRGSSSAPTSRVLDVVELLSQPGDSPMRFSDIVRELDLTQATAHSILKTLSDRGWVTRDPMTKTFALGPAHVIARGTTRRRAPADASGTRRDTAPRRDHGHGRLRRGEDRRPPRHHRAWRHPEGSDIAVTPNERIPYSPPFGVAFAAWDDATSRDAWIARGAADDAALTGTPQRRTRVHTHARIRRRLDDALAGAGRLRHWRTLRRRRAAAICAP